jgi:DNA-directed RNA polymerase subunit N (RpoN/RPB10)
MADKIDYYVSEVEKLKASNTSVGSGPTDAVYKNFDEVHSKKILDDLGLTRYCCRRNLISNVDLMHII